MGTLYAQPPPTHYRTSFRLAANLILVEASAGARSGYFVVDSGSSHTILNSVHFTAEHQLVQLRTYTGDRALGGTLHTTLKLGPWTEKMVFAALGDLSALEKRLQLPLLGLIGMNVLRNYELHLDYRSTTIEFYRLGKKGEPLRKCPAGLPARTLGFRYARYLPLIEAELAGQTFTWGLDTGAGVNLFDVSTAQRIGLQTTDQRSAITTIGQPCEKGKAGLFRAALQLGELQTTPMNTLCKDLRELNRQLPGPRIDGILGFAFLSQQRTAINFRKRELYLWPSLPAGMPVTNVKDYITSN